MHRYHALLAAAHPGIDFNAVAAGIRGRSPAGQRADDYMTGIRLARRFGRLAKRWIAREQRATRRAEKRSHDNAQNRADAYRGALYAAANGDAATSESARIMLAVGVNSRRSLYRAFGLTP